MLKLIANKSQVCFGLTTALISCEHGPGSTFSFIRATVEATNPQIRLRFPQAALRYPPKRSTFCLEGLLISRYRAAFLFVNRQALFVCQGYVYFAQKNFLRRVKQPPNILQKLTKHLPFKHTQYFESCHAIFRVALLKHHNMAPNAINFHSATCLPPKRRISVGRITRVVAELPDHVYPRWLPKDSGVYMCALRSV